MKVKNPFFKVGKVVGKFAKVAGLSIAGMAASVGFAHFTELLPVLFATFGSPWAELLTMLAGGLLAGGAEAVRNFQKHHYVDKDKLQKILDDVMASDDAIGTLEGYGMSKAEAFKFVKVLAKVLKSKDIKL